MTTVGGFQPRALILWIPNVVSTKHRYHRLFSESEASPYVTTTYNVCWQRYGAFTEAGAVDVGLRRRVYTSQGKSLPVEGAHNFAQTWLSPALGVGYDDAVY